jgi:outer membrane protein OmpA-like peptidoglycan-associated protein
MKNRTFLFVCLFAGLTISVMAQQGNTNSNAQGESQVASAASQSGREPIPADTHKDFWDGDDPNFGNLVTHPFASKKYVQRHTQPIRDRLNELDALTSENGKMTKDADARAQQGLQMAAEKTSLADQHATDAGTKAQSAQAAATEASTRVAATEQRVGNLDQYKGSAQTEIRFRAGQSALSKDAKDALDQMAGTLKDQRSYIIEVRGFAPGHGQAAITSSQKMADSVVRYLVLTHQIPVYRIYMMSMGNAALGDGTAAKHGSSARVEVSVLKNDMVSTAQR